VQKVLDTFKAKRFSEAPHVVPGMLDALTQLRRFDAHVVICTNANAMKVSQEWSTIVQANWPTLLGMQVPDAKKLAHIYHSDRPDQPSQTRATDWEKVWSSLQSQVSADIASPKEDKVSPTNTAQTDLTTVGADEQLTEPKFSTFRMDILGKCGKGDLPQAYPEEHPSANLNPKTLAALGITPADTLYFVGNEIKDAAAAHYLADQGFNVRFYFLNQFDLPEAIDHLAKHLAKQRKDHADHEELTRLLHHCQRWDLANWSAATRVEDGYELLASIVPTLSKETSPKILMDFHGTITDQIQTFTDLVDAKLTEQPAEESTKLSTSQPKGSEATQP
jgi:hypothetical protein